MFNCSVILFPYLFKNQVIIILNFNYCKKLQINLIQNIKFILLLYYIKPLQKNSILNFIYFITLKINKVYFIHIIYYFDIQVFYINFL